MTSTVNGLPVPDDVDPLGQGAAAIRALAGRINPVASGIVSLAFAGTSTKTVAVTFPVGRFPTAPSVTVSASGSAILYGYVVSSASTTGVTVGLAQRDNGAVTANIGCQWQAIGTA